MNKDVERDFFDPAIGAMPASTSFESVTDFFSSYRDYTTKVMPSHNLFKNPSARSASGNNFSSA